jgi:hypothetical protein
VARLAGWKVLFDSTLRLQHFVRPGRPHLGLLSRSAIQTNQLPGHDRSLPRRTVDASPPFGLHQYVASLGPRWRPIRWCCSGDFGLAQPAVRVHQRVSLFENQMRLGTQVHRGLRNTR